MNASIVKGNAQPLTNSDNPLELAFTKAQTLIIQTRDKDAFMSFSIEGLQHQSSRFKLSRYEPLTGSHQSGLVLTFPQAAFTGSLFFASANPTDVAKVAIWQICENSYY
tara:strand:- start:15 stop:341 length:327 start_codon:yes stop_codon:yes gene_type:complete